MRLIMQHLPFRCFTPGDVGNSFSLVHDCHLALFEILNATSALITAIGIFEPNPLHHTTEESGLSVPAKRGSDIE